MLKPLLRIVANRCIRNRFLSYQHGVVDNYVDRAAARVADARSIRRQGKQ
jgi:hypothetical protein